MKETSTTSFTTQLANPSSIFLRQHSTFEAVHCSPYRLRTDDQCKASMARLKNIQKSAVSHFTTHPKQTLLRQRVSHETVVTGLAARTRSEDRGPGRCPPRVLEHLSFNTHQYQPILLTAIILVALVAAERDSTGNLSLRANSGLFLEPSVRST